MTTFQFEKNEDLGERGGRAGRKDSIEEPLGNSYLWHSALLKVTGIKLPAVRCEEKAFLSPVVMAVGMTGYDNNSVL